MEAKSYKSVMLNKATVQKEWLLVDASDLSVGRLCSQLAMVLRGKHKPGFTPHVDCGDNVIVINAEKVKLTGIKLDSKTYVSHSGYPGGQKHEVAKELMKRKPTMVIEHGVKGMLPRNRLSRRVIRNLYVYAGTQHPHEAQKPKVFNINEIKK